MPTPVIMPRLGMTMDEGTVIQWFKHEGDRVEQGKPLLEIMTDKVNMEIEAPASGIVRGIGAEPEATVPVGQVIAYILQDGESLPGPGAPSALPAPDLQALAPAPVPILVTVHPGRVAASPLAKKRAREAGLDLHSVKGSGPGGRVIEVDIRAALAALATATAAPAPAKAASPAVAPVQPVSAKMDKVGQPRPGTLVALAGKRKVIAERMAASAQVPQFALGLDADMTRAEEARAGYSFTAFLVRVVAHALAEHPFVNATFRPDGIFLHEDINIGVAVSADDGLVVPVIKHAGRKNLRTLDQELKDLAARARSATLSLDDISGATFTISNLGMLGIEEFKALINPPEAAILATGRVVAKPLALGDTVVVRPVMHLVLSADHRVLDGATAAAFLAEVKSLLENPYQLL